MAAAAEERYWLTSRAAHSISLLEKIALVGGGRYGHLLCIINSTNESALAMSKSMSFTKKRRASDPTLLERVEWLLTVAFE